MSSVLLDFVPPSQKMSFFDCRPRKSKKFKVTSLQGVCCNTIDRNRDSDWCHVGACMVFSACHQPQPQPQGEEVKLLITSNYLWNNLITGFVLAGFFSWPCARKNIPLGNLWPYWGHLMSGRRDDQYWHRPLEDHATPWWGFRHV